MGDARPIPYRADVEEGAGAAEVRKARPEHVPLYCRAKEKCLDECTLGRSNSRFMNNGLMVLRASFLSSLALIFLATNSSSPAATVSLHPVADTTLEQAYPEYNFGGGTTFTAGGRRNGGRRPRCGA